MKLFEKILCPVDFSENSVHALSWSESFAREFGSQVVLLHVLNLYPVTGEISVDYDRFQNKAQSDLTDFSAGLKIPHQKMLSTGDPAKKILSLAKGLEATIIVMGTRGLRGTMHKLLGSTTESVIRKSPLPVLTVSPHCRSSLEERTGRALVPISSLQWPAKGYLRLKKVIRDLDAAPTLFHVIDYHDEMFNSSFSANPMLVTSYETMEKQQQLKLIGTRLVRPNQSPEAVIQFGDAAKEVLKEGQSGRYDFILMGAKKSSMMTRFIESTVYHVVSNSELPVLTVRTK